MPVLSAIDAPGQGWLRLTDAQNSQSGSAVYNTPFSSNDGVLAEFEYATWGGNGADGFTFYLLDGSVNNPPSGASDGSLGYSSWGSRPGVPKGYLGIGFDEFGNFSNPSFGGCSLPGGPTCTRVPNSIAIRGKDNSAAGDGGGPYPLLASVVVPEGVATAGRAGARKVRITVTPAPTIYVTVEVDFNGSGYRKVIDSLDISTSNGAPPATFKMGFSGGTGSLNNVHEVRFLGGQGARTASVALTSSAPAVCGASPTNLTATVTGSDPTQIPSGSVTFMEGTTTLGSAPLDAGVATLPVVLTPGMHNVVANYSGDSAYSTTGSPTASASGQGAACNTTITFTPSVVGQCGPVTLSATLSSTAGQAVPTGTVIFKDGGVSLTPAATLNGAGVAQWTGSLASGDHPITVEYSGDPNYASSNVGPITQTGTNPVCGTPAVTAGTYAASTLVNEPVSIAILYSDQSSDPIGAPLAQQSVQPDTDPTHLPSHGAVVFSNNSVVYTPNENYVGTDSFKYTICTVVAAPYTTQACGVAVVNVTVTKKIDQAAVPVPFVNQLVLLLMSAVLVALGVLGLRRK
ncbi:hypothetical protein G7047_30330 (plasmid) [Diaphorobacter sp. HDW4A]|uniref:Ig-like domain repeat protein n=1 Tax=Diaphorobacter sp. HDW4A TaxID=2714924 RepID=UPI00140BC230|nr:Ig-like domain repeat protein [Diaphorobacter sp. HDW4A]QIL84318.1 hypothetical protein G7047_30330 [Diaphorobacter sp. HDW4A]